MIFCIPNGGIDSPITSRIIESSDLAGVKKVFDSDRNSNLYLSFQLISTNFYKVEKTNNCNQIAKLVLPADTDFATWYLNLPIKMANYSF